MIFMTSCGVSNIVFILLLTFQFTFVHGLINRVSCAGDNCVQQDSQGRWCYVPVPILSTSYGVYSDCGGGTNLNSTVFAVMAVHLKQGLSIAYYSGVDNVLLGGVDFPFPTSGGIVMICSSGKANDGSYQTLCLKIHKDNDIGGVFGDPYCIIGVGQDVVSDGCYVPMSGVVVAPSSASTVLQTVFGALVTATITASGTIQTVLVPVAGNNNNSTFNYGKGVVLPIVLSILGVILIVICLGAWLWRKRMRLQRELLMNRGVGPLNQPIGTVGVRTGGATHLGVGPLNQPGGGW